MSVEYDPLLWGDNMKPEVGGVILLKDTPVFSGVGISSVCWSDIALILPVQVF